MRQPESSRLHGSRVDAKASESKVGCGSRVDGTQQSSRRYGGRVACTEVESAVRQSRRRCGKAVESTERSVNWSCQDRCASYGARERESTLESGSRGEVQFDSVWPNRKRRSRCVPMTLVPRRSCIDRATYF